MYYGAFQRAQGSLQEIWSNLTSLYQDNLFLANFNEFLDLKPKLVKPASPVAFPRPLTAGIGLEHVSFRYPTANRPVLSDINLQIRPGQMVALVGENGSGKTSLIKLLCRLYDPESGRITFDGIEATRFDPEKLREEVSVILQDYAHYSLTARENVWLGDIKLSLQDNKIVTAANLTRAHEIIQKLPRGYETILGN
jgi:ATP-binding cassette subfamily B protein